MIGVLEVPQLVVAADERRLQALRPVAAAPLGDDPQRAPGRDRSLLALQRLLAGRFEEDREVGGPLRRLADEDRARRCDGLEPGCGVHEVARDHALVGGPDRHGRLAGQDRGATLEPLVTGRASQLADRLDELQAGPNGPLRVVLEDDRRAPDGHHRVADELLDRAAVPTDDLAGDVEVAAQEFPDLFRVGAVGARREPDEIGEQHAHEPPLGHVRFDGQRWRSGRCRIRCRRTVGAADGRTRTRPWRRRSNRGRLTGFARGGRSCRGRCGDLVEPVAALATEPDRGPVGKAAIGARAGEARAAFAAELAAWLVGGAARGTVHEEASGKSTASLGRAKGSHSVADVDKRSRPAHRRLAARPAARPGRPSPAPVGTPT